MERVRGKGYSFEADLVLAFADRLRAGTSPWGVVQLTFEFDYNAGWSDVVALCGAGELVAFEAKLARWRDALHQAYRNRCFAHRAYVVLPERAARTAAQYEQEFRRRRVGLCSMSADRGIEVILEVEPAPPLQPWVATKAVDEIHAEREANTRWQQTQSSCRSRRRSALRAD